VSAKQKIEGLTNSWYGYSLFAAVLGVFSVRASGPFALMIGLGMSVVINAVALVIALAIVGLLGRALVRRSSGTRSFLVFVSGLFTLLGVLATVGAGWDFLRSWSLSGVLSIVTMAACTMMNARSFNVLTDKSVKAYCV
jgi:hypothetical protein